METEYRDFTFFGAILEDLDDGLDTDEGITKTERDEMLVMAIEYGSKGEIPEGLKGYRAKTFKGIQRKIDQSLVARGGGKKGGRPKKEQENNPRITKVSKTKNLGFETQKPGLQDDETSYLILSNHKEKNKKENSDDEKTATLPAPDNCVRCSFCGTPVKKRQMFTGGKPTEMLICAKGHVCDEYGNSLNHKGKEEDDA